MSGTHSECRWVVRVVANQVGKDIGGIDFFGGPPGVEKMHLLKAEVACEVARTDAHYKFFIFVRSLPQTAEPWQ
jgi:hypothetical protein